MKSRRLPRLRAVLKLPRSVPGVVDYARALRSVLAGDPVTFPSPPLALSDLDKDIAAVEKAQAGVATRARGKSGFRDAAFMLLMSDLDLIRAYVQRLMDLDPSRAAIVAAKALMYTTGRRNVARVDVKLKRPKGVPGAVDAVFRKKVEKETRYAQYSVDAMVTWIDLEPTLHARIQITGLVPGSTLWFRYRTMTSAGTTEPSDPISIIVL
jgi:hypothetical protein